MIKYYIYALWNKNENDVFYIGVSKKIKARFNQHKSKYRKLGIEINYSIIDEIDCEEDSDFYFDIESYWIEQFKQWGFKLVNSNYTIKSQYRISPKRSTKMFGCILLKNIPPDVMRFIFEKQTEYKIKHATGRYSLSDTIIQIIREQMEISNVQSKTA